MSRDIAVIVNAKAGSSSESSAEAIRHAFHDLGLEPDVIVAGGGELQRAAEKAPAAGRTLVAAGGDGTVSTVAGVAVAARATFGVIPLGTLNHFAKDAGIPLALDAAVAAIGAGHAVMLDTGVLNGRTFLNNASVGFYAHIVRERQLEQRRGHGKWTAFAIALAREWGRYGQLTVRMTVDGTPLERRTPFVFIGNGDYVDEGLGLGQRTSIATGSLWIALAPECDRADMLVLMARALVGRLTPEVKLEQFHATELTIEPRTAGAGIAVDGELMPTRPPYHCTLERGALRVLLPGAARG